MRGQSGEPVDSLGAAHRWVAARADRWSAGSAYSFAVVDGDGDGDGDTAPASW
jgi:hypothetical protein